MKAVICRQENKAVAVESFDLPPLGHNDVLLRTDASGVCATDLSMVRGYSGQAMPMVLGHEGAGTVVKVGQGVSRCKLGDRVIASWAPACGQCWHCVRSETQHCEELANVYASYALIDRDGSAVPTMAGLGTFAEMMLVSELSVMPVTTDLPAEQLALIGCGVTTGVGAVLWTAQVKPGATVAIFGCGGVGLSAVQAAGIAGAGRILAVDPLPSKREWAARFGATDLIDPTQGAVDQILAATGGRGVDYAFEMTGIPSLLQDAFASVRKRGTAVAVGMPPVTAAVEVPVFPLFFNEKRLIGSMYGSVQFREHFPMLVGFAERGRLNLDAMISRRIGLADVDATLASLGEPGVIRNVVLPG